MKTDTKFQQRHKVGVAGSFFNQMMSNNATLPEVGKGATQMMYSDRYVYEVIEVSDDHKTVKLESLNAKIDPEYLASLKGRDCIGHQNWVFEPTGHYSTIVWKWNAWRVKCRTVQFTEAFATEAEKAGKRIWEVLTDEQRTAIYGDDIRPQNVVEGFTEERYTYDNINILFGCKNYHYDWSF